MNFPENLHYHPEHLWVREQDDGKVAVGVTDFAQDQLGKVIYIELPDPGEEVSQGEDMGAIESAKSVSDLIAPVSGEVLEINQGLNDDPSPINQDPYGDGWMVVIQLSGGLPESLLGVVDYKKQVS